jgi:predicted nucleotidyltransferase component of viral defense system
MQQLQDLERLEIEVLDVLNSIKVLDALYFGGGTMLRLCHNLTRYSTDLDFWLGAASDAKMLFDKIKNGLSERYRIVDVYNKKNTLLFEFRAAGITRSLKIEIRKEQGDFQWEKKIAFSKFSTKQVMLNGLTLEQMMKNKTAALLSRKLIRDAFDIEFLLMRGVNLPSEIETLEKILSVVNNFKDKDFKVTLGAVLEQKEREYYIASKFKLLKEEITGLMLKR